MVAVVVRVVDGGEVGEERSEKGKVDGLTEEAVEDGSSMVAWFEALSVARLTYGEEGGEEETMGMAEAEWMAVEEGEESVAREEGEVVADEEEAEGECISFKTAEVTA